MSQKVLLGLSGGVDSAVAAYLLKEQGYDVTCAFMRNWDSFANNDIMGNPTIQDDVCPQEQDYLDAKEVADRLGLPLLRVDFVKEYWDHVFTYFLDEYRKGRTPNPDILCNKYIKFDAFMNYARKLGFDVLATGHYAQVDHSGKESRMLRGADSNKDQTYFLCQVSQDALRHSMFPIGHMEKHEVREIAERMELNSVSKKKDSTGICFIGERNFKEFLKNYLPSQDGDIMDIETLETIGRHGGVLYYTIGQRKGLGIGGNRGPWFVVGKDVQKNILYVTNGSESDWLYSDSCIVSGVNWFSENKPQGELVCTAKFRYRQPDNDVILRFIDNTTVYVRYPQLVSSVTAGQEAVFYQNEECLGGGVIEDVFKEGISLQHRINRRVEHEK
ncbi:tRNA 2-thiouridine(34) synthase MnmA [Erysipelotrichaceae bacterium AF15-26LB]|nr:tRNA (5-methylaminomethyl-2-thiouridylate)-methyltransferase [Erysipelotrichaceae bacterium 3_1_53]MCR0347417.1 tRNA 2-thiouridine(34) synthase MnmA [[Clostridium] innocuum]RJV88781.1 tRNA 2-thiouridine(34) synthase MnmA [Erysipelotrichaceae bacterium AF19-24AC]RJV92836.1 tRNA 2-thiouridine(34) synthase MnmA [Erysipelotrichaceae bacterium AF15-26LB]